MWLVSLSEFEFGTYLLIHFILAFYAYFVFIASFFYFDLFINRYILTASC